jgi:O-antigen ligase
MNKTQLANSLTYLILFLLPWQTRYIVAAPTLQGGAWEYGVMSIYVVEVLILLATLFRGRAQWIDGAWNVQRATYLFLGGCFFSVAFSIYYHLSLFSLLHIIMAILLFGLMADRRVCKKKLIGSFLAGLVIPSFLAWWQVLTGGSGASTLLGVSAQNAEVLGVSVVEVDGQRLLRGYGSFPHPNIFGGYLAVGMMLLAWISFKREWIIVKSIKEVIGGMLSRKPILKPLLERWGAYGVEIVLTTIGIILFASTLVITFSRSAWLALFVGLGVVFFFHLIFKKHISKKALKLLLIGLLTLVITMMTFGPAVMTRISGGTQLESNSIEERVSGYAWFDDIVGMNIFTGVGIGTYTAALSVVDEGHESYEYQPLHNTLLLMLSELGLIGFALFVIWFTAIDLTCYRKGKTLGGIFGMGIGSTILVLALFDHYPWSNWAGLSLMAVVFALMLRFGLEAKKT